MKSLPTPEFYAALQTAYDHFNKELFGGRLPPVMLTVQRQPRMMGFVSSERWANQSGDKVFELAINPEYFVGYSIIEVLQTTAHEQVHIDQMLHGNPGRRGYHNQEWADMMLKIGLVPSDTGRPGGKRTGERMSDYALIDGGFFRSASRLISGGFILPWLDRAPVINHSRFNVYTRKDEPVDFSNRADMPLVLPMGKKERYTPPAPAVDAPTYATLSPVTQESVSELEAAINIPTALSHGFNDLSVLPITLNRKPTRVKYICECPAPDGPNAVWGKPKLKITCEECGKSFKPDRKDNPLATLNSNS